MRGSASGALFGVQGTGDLLWACCNRVSGIVVRWQRVGGSRSRESLCTMVQCLFLGGQAASGSAGESLDLDVVLFGVGADPVEDRFCPGWTGSLPKPKARPGCIWGTGARIDYRPRCFGVAGPPSRVKRRG